MITPKRTLRLRQWCKNSKCQKGTKGQQGLRCRPQLICGPGVRRLRMNGAWVLARPTQQLALSKILDSVRLHPQRHRDGFLVTAGYGVGGHAAVTRNQSDRKS